MKDRPFALLGINNDKSLEVLRKVIQENGINWRNVWDDPKSPDSAVKKWNIRGFPSAVLIDGKGVIRKRYLGIDEAVFEADIEALVVETEAAAAK